MNELQRPTLRGCQRWVGVALAVYWVAIFIGTHIPLPDLGDFPQHSDKFVHLASYAGLAFLLGLWRAARRGGLTFREYAIVFAVTLVYAVVDELLQEIPVLNRTGDVDDALADVCGSGLGLIALLAFIRLFPRFVQRREQNEPQP